jgi:hypothetical protein
MNDLSQIVTGVMIAAVAIVVVGRLLTPKIIRIGSFVFFVASAILFVYFIVQSVIYARQECLIEDGCMNEFGGFIVFPVVFLIIAILLWLFGKPNSTVI